MARIPGLSDLKWYQRKWISELFTLGPTLIAGSTSVYLHISNLQTKTVGIWLLGSLIWTVILQGFIVFRTHQEEVANYGIPAHDGLRAPLLVLHNIISQKLNFSAQDHQKERLRLTIHRVKFPKEKDKDPEKIEQLLDYVGGKGNKKGRGRVFSISAGITGSSVRNNEVYVAKRRNNDHEKFIKELKERWSYTDKTARDLKSDRMSWMAVPISGSDGIVIAVVFLDSFDLNIFDSTDIKEVILSACLGISTYINERYK
jgi:ribosomal protein L13E